MSNQVSFFDHPVKTNYPIYLEECNSPAKNKIFKETIDKHHSYKKYTDMPTRRINWLIYETVSGNLIGAIGISSATIAISCRDAFIGWSPEIRIKNLGMLANNSRFCMIRENTTIKNVGSMTLKRLEIDGGTRWKEKYDQDLVLLETFVQAEREDMLDGKKTRNGSVYKATNWSEIGITSGNSIKKAPLQLWKKEKGERGKVARENPKLALELYGNYGGKEYIIGKSLPKMMFVKPLVKDWKERLSI